MTAEMSGVSNENPPSELSCSLCRTSHSSEWELKEHLWSLLHHVKLEQKDKNSLHECVLCQKVCDDLLEYGRHLNELQHKQALEKAKEKKKGKAKMSHPRNVFQKGGRGKSRWSLMPNPNWHLNPVNQHSLRVGAKLQPQFTNRKSVTDWRRNGPKDFNSFGNPGMHPPFPNNHYWNNSNYCDNKNNFHPFYKNDQNSYNRWKNPSLLESNQPNLSTKNKMVTPSQPLIINKYLVASNFPNLKKDLPSSKVPTSCTTDSNEHSSRLSPESSCSVKNPLKTADSLKSSAEKPIPSKTSQIKKNSSIPPQPKVTTSDQTSKSKTSVTKLKAKRGTTKADVSSKQKPSQTGLFFIDKNKTDPLGKVDAEIAEPVSKKYVVAASTKKTTGNGNAVSVNKETASPPQPRVPLSLKNGKPIETEKISAPVVKKTKTVSKPLNSRDRNSSDKPTDFVTRTSRNTNSTVIKKTKTVLKPISSTERNSSGKPTDSDTKTSRDSNSADDATTLTKRNLASTDTPNISPVPNKKQKTLSSSKCGSSEASKKIAESKSPNLPTLTNSESQQKSSLENEAPKQNDDGEKEKPPGISVNHTEERKSLPVTFPLGGNENGFKVNNELVTKLHKKLIGQNPIKQFKSNVKSPEHQSPSKDEANPSGKSSSGNVRQEELVKMMKLPRLNRKEKMHLSSLLQSYTKSQNKKLAVPRLTMQLSGVYDDSAGISSNIDSISTDKTSDLELPAGMEEQIAHLIKHENLESVSPVEATKGSNLGISVTQLEESPLQNAGNKNSSVSVRQKRNGKRKTIPEKSKPNESSSSSSSLQSPKIEVSNDNNNAEDFSSNGVSTSIALSSSQPITDRQESTASNPMVSDSQLNNNNSSSSSNLPNPSEYPSQAISSAPETTGTPSNSTENLSTSSNENIFNKVYQLTLREEQIRSSIVDMNEKMNYLRKLIEDSQMALQGCCIEHKRLLDEESGIRDQRLKILQDAMSNKNVGGDSANNVQLPQPNPSSQQARTIHQTEQTFPQTDTNQQMLSLPQPQIRKTNQQMVSLQQPQIRKRNQQSSCLGSDVISSVGRNGNQILQSLPCTTSSDIPSNTVSNFRSPNQSHVHPEALPNNRPLTIQPVNRNRPSKQNLPNRVSPRRGSDDTSTDKTAVSEDGNIGSNVTSNRDPSFGVAPITIKQELPSSPEMTLHTDNESIAPLKKQVDALSNNTRKQGLPSGATEQNAMPFESVEIKEEVPTATSRAEKEGVSSGSQLQLAGSKGEALRSVPTESHDVKQQSSDLRGKNVSDKTPKLLSDDSDNPNADPSGRLSSVSKITKAEPVINFESIQIKEEPLTPPPQVENEETFFVPQLLRTENMDKKNSRLSEENQMDSQTTGMKKTVETPASASSSNNLLGSTSRNENLEKSRGMSMRYLGSMPNNFLEQLTLSWKKQNSSALAIEASAQSTEHSFSDSESMSSRNVSSFVQKLGPQFSVPDEMNPRVCLEPLNMKFHRKRTLSEPLSNGGSASPLKANNGLEEEFQADPKRESEGDESSDAGKTDSVKQMVFEEPVAKHKHIKCRKRVKMNRPQFKTDPTTCDDILNTTSKTASLDEKLNDANLVSSARENLKGTRIYCLLSDDSSRDSDGQLNDPVGTSDNLNQTSTASSDLSPRELNYDPEFPANPMNILNNLSMVHAVRTKKFPRVHVNGSQQLPTFKSVSSPVNGLYVFEENLYASYQGSSPCKFSINTGECLQVYNCTPYSVQCMLVCRVNKTRTYLFSGGASELLLIFDEVTGRLCSKIDTCRKIYSFHENWGNLFVGLADGGVTKVNLKFLKKTSELSYGSKPINCLATCTEAAQKLLCVGAYDASILIVDAMTGLLLKTLNCYHRLLYSIKVHQNLIFSCSSDKTLQVHDVTTGKLLRCLLDHTSTISCLHVDDHLLATGSHDKRLNVYNSSNPTEAPVIFFTSSKEPISCLAIHKNLAYCGNFFGHIDTIRIDTEQKWLCKYDSCQLIFGQRKGLFYHLVNYHLQMTCLDRIKCKWEDCGEYICSVLDITEHCENHLNNIVHHE